MEVSTEVTIKLKEDEAQALKATLGLLSLSFYRDNGISEEQAEAMHQLYTLLPEARLEDD